MKRKVEGYLTVEATFVMPITFGIYILIILAMLVLYDRIVVDQNLARSLVSLSNSVRLQEQIEELDTEDIRSIMDTEKLLWMDIEEIEYSVRGNLVNLGVTGDDYKKNYRILVENPVYLLRLEKRIMDRKEGEEGE